MREPESCGGTRDPVDTILAQYGVRGPWQVLHATGIANRIYATPDVVLRIATDNPDAVVDARTESVAAPVARAAGISTPRLIASDDSRALIDRPFSLWERVHGETLGLLNLRADERAQVWHEVGLQIARLHVQVVSCPDPNGYLDTPTREMELDLLLKQLGNSGHASHQTIQGIESLIQFLRPHVVSAVFGDCFLHNDLHEMNIMCTAIGALLAIIDWGDAGWGDPALDFAAVPLEFISSTLEGYGRQNRHRLGTYPEARFIWDRLPEALETATESPEYQVPVAAYRRFLDRS